MRNVSSIRICIQSLILLIVLTNLISANVFDDIDDTLEADVEEEGQSTNTRRFRRHDGYEAHHKRHQIHRHHKRRQADTEEHLRRIVCVNGELINGKCSCDLDWLGDHCEKRKNCNSYLRHSNGRCIKCADGFEGEFCENIICENNGQPDKYFIKCECARPWSGKHCDKLETKNVYLLYNQRAFMMGPLGALTLIPMCLIYIFCEKSAKTRQEKRVQQNWNVLLDHKAADNVVKTLLQSKTKA